MGRLNNAGPTITSLRIADNTLTNTDDITIYVSGSDPSGLGSISLNFIKENNGGDFWVSANPFDNATSVSDYAITVPIKLDGAKEEGTYELRQIYWQDADKSSINSTRLFDDSSFISSLSSEHSEVIISHDNI